MKKQILMMVCLLVAISVDAQTKRKTKFNIGLDIATPATDQAYAVYKIGFGGTVKALFPTGKLSYITATTGVVSFAGRAGNPRQVLNNPALAIFDNTNIAHPALTTIPFKIGYQTPFSAKSKWYAEAETGYTYGDVLGLVETVKTSDVSGLTIALGFGVHLTKGFEISWRYEGFQTKISRTEYTSFVSVRSLVNIDW